MSDGVFGRDSVSVGLQRVPKKHLFTVVIATQANAFIRQVVSETSQSALDSVLQSYKDEGKSLGDIDNPVLMKDLKNTWGATFSDDNGFALATVIKTDREESDE